MALKIIAILPKTALLRLFNYSNVPFRTSTMKKYICILASAALLAACEQKTETTEPAATPTSTTPPAAATGVRRQPLNLPPSHRPVSKVWGSPFS